MKCSLAVTQQHQKGTKFHKNNRSLLVHGDVVEFSSTTVVKVDIKVTNASLFNSKSMFSICRLNAVTPPLTHVEIPRPRDATELNNDGMIKSATRVHYTTKQNRIYQFFQKRFKRDLINDDSSFCLHILSAIDLQCHVFPFEKLSLNVRLCL